MGKSGTKGTLLQIMAAGLVLASVVLAFALILRADLRTGEFWKNYYTVITSDSSKTEALLERHGIEFLSFDTSRVLYNDIPLMTEIALSELSSRFHADDPRLDPYMKNVSRLFTASTADGEKPVIYVSADSISLFSLYELLRNLSGNEGVEWKIGGFDLPDRALPLFFFSLFAAAVLILQYRSAGKIFAVLAGWTPMVFLSGFPAAGMAATLFFIVRRKVSPLIPLFLTAAALFLLSLKGDLSPLTLLPAIPGIAGTFLLSGKDDVPQAVRSGSPGGRKWRRKKRLFSKPEHRLFEPVRIMDAGPLLSEKGRNVSPEGKPGLLKGAVFLFLAGSLVFSVSRKAPESHLLPLPSTSVEAGWSLDATEKTFGAGGLIAPADYIAHVAYQEGLMFRSRWTFPSAGTSLRYPVYREEEKGFSKSYENIEDYSEKWFQDVVSTLKPHNPAKLLFSTDGPVIVEKKSDQPIYRPNTLLKSSFFMLLLLLSFFIDRSKHIKTSFSVRKKLLRRNEQVA